MARESLRKSFTDIDVAPVFIPPAPASSAKAIADRNAEDKAKDNAEDAAAGADVVDAGSDEATGLSAASGGSEAAVEVPAVDAPAGNVKAAEGLSVTETAGEEPAGGLPADETKSAVVSEPTTSVPATDVASASVEKDGQRAKDKPKPDVSEPAENAKSSVVANVGRPKIFATPPVKVLVRVDAEVDNHALDVMSARRKAGSRGMSRNQVYVDWLTVAHLILDAKDKNVAAQIARKFYCDNHPSSPSDDLPAEADEAR